MVRFNWPCVSRSIRPPFTAFNLQPNLLGAQADQRLELVFADGLPGMNARPFHVAPIAPVQLKPGILGCLTKESPLPCETRRRVMDKHVGSIAQRPHVTVMF